MNKITVAARIKVLKEEIRDARPQSNDVLQLLGSVNHLVHIAEAQQAEITTLRAEVKHLKRRLASGETV
jgi:hypothetical protein